VSDLGNYFVMTLIITDHTNTTCIKTRNGRIDTN